MTDYRWHILGAGSLGSLMALRLGQARIPVDLLHYRSDVTERRIVWEGQEHRLPVRTVRSLDPASVNYLLICTKAGQVPSAIAQAAPMLGKEAVVIAMANGRGFEGSPEAQGLSGGLRRAISTAGAYGDELGLIRAIDLGQTRIGDPRNPEPIPHWFENSLALLQEWSWDTQIEQTIGKKFSINCVINPLTARRRCRNGELLTDPEGFRQLQALCTESEPVLRQLGFWSGEPLLHVAESVCRSTAKNRSSMLQDVLAGRKTEIEFLNGELLRLAPDADLPLNRRLVAELTQSR